ncbi:MAG: 50S ribosomal protein L29 [Candidatus Omnitrophica bacterium]|nr:50S ribosomal protein L29 [Candidatus Omnitrophota bacterium]
MALRASEIRNMTEAEISIKLVSLKEELFKLRFEQKTGRVEKPHRISVARKDIARLLTILKEKENAKG